MSNIVTAVSLLKGIKFPKKCINLFGAKPCILVDSDGSVTVSFGEDYEPIDEVVRTLKDIVTILEAK